MRTCGNCEYNDGCVYTSLPPRYKCTITGEFHFGKEPCSAEFAPVWHGRWIEEPNCWYRCSNCGSHYPSIRGYMDYNYCPSCGARMDGEENG